MSKAENKNQLLTLENSFAEAIDIFVEEFMPELLMEWPFYREGGLKLAYIEPNKRGGRRTVETYTIRPSYHEGYYDIIATKNLEAGRHEPERPLESAEFVISQDSLQTGSLSVTYLDHTDHTRFEGKTTLSEMETTHQAAYDLLQNAQITLMIRLATEALERDIFDAFALKVKALFDRCFDRETSDLLWDMAKKIKFVGKKSKTP